jgi:hypothetical protein
MGLCVGLLGIGGISASLQEGSSSDAARLLVELVQYGLIPLAVGALLIWVGLRLREKK